MSVIGSISIKDNVTATLRIIKKEQTSFREDVKKTREEMEKTWKEKYQAKLDATPATKALNSLKSKNGTAPEKSSDGHGCKGHGHNES